MSKCESQCNGIRDAEYLVTFRGGQEKICGYCLISMYITSNGLNKRVVSIDRISQSDTVKA